MNLSPPEFHAISRGARDFVDAACDKSRLLKCWLLDTPQVADGAEAGGVAGSIDANGCIEYVYPEITGYYLQWLAWRSAVRGADDGLRTRAAAALRWIERWARHSDPLRTRVHLDGATRDWRNDFVFCFDIAMVLRGIASCSRQGLLRADPATVRALDAVLQQLVDADGQFAACRPEAAEPCRWSTRRGPFLAKAAAGVLYAARILPEITDGVGRAATATYTACLAGLGKRSPHRDVHPLLYAIEGALVSVEVADEVAEDCGRHVESLLTQLRAHGRLTERPGSDIARIDITAQTLRAIVVLQSLPAGWRTDPRLVTALRERLRSAVRPDGGVPFVSGSANANVWAAMFTEQALSLEQSPSADVNALRTLVV